MKLCVKLGVVPLDAVKVSGKVPVVVGFPVKVAVPLLFAVKVTPPGSAPFSLIVGVSMPLLWTVNVEVLNVGNAALEPLVIAGATAGTTKKGAENASVTPSENWLL